MFCLCQCAAAALNEMAAAAVSRFLHECVTEPGSRRVAKKLRALGGHRVVKWLFDERPSKLFFCFCKTSFVDKISLQYLQYVPS